MRRTLSLVSPNGLRLLGNKTATRSTLSSPTLYICSRCTRSASTKASPSKSFASTLLLPKTKFKLWPDYSARESSLAKRTNEELYASQSNTEQPVFLFHDGPPYANGALHMGHALNKILKDIINRFQVLKGNRVNYVPGWDCHGLPIESKTLELLKAAPNTLPAAEVRKHAEKFARKQVKSQMTEFQRLSIMTSWEDHKTYRTIDRNYELRQLRLLQEMVRKKLIHRRHKPVFWSPSSVSALAEAEVQYVDDHASRSAYIAFPVQELSDSLAPIQELVKSEEEVCLLIWTTTPWTIPANMAIAVNVNMTYSVVRHHDQASATSRLLIIATELLESVESVFGPLEVIGQTEGSSLVGLQYTNKAFGHSKFPLRVLPSTHVTSFSGTGLVHMAPAHGAEDYDTFRQLGHSTSELLSPVDDWGKYTSQIITLTRDEEHGKRLLGKEVLNEGNSEVLLVLKETGMLLAQHSYKHRYPYDSRTNKPMIIRATSQWFADVGAIKQQALDALSDVTFHPASARVRLEAFVRERSEWCISRQRVWGSPIPSLHDVRTGEAVLTAESMDHIVSILEQKGPAYWWTGPVEDFVPPSLQSSGREFKKGTDTIDVWFDSGSSWTMLDSLLESDTTVGETPLRASSPGPASHPPIRVRRADVCLEGSDQHRGWFQSLLLTAVAATPEGETPVAPFKNLISHGFVLDESGRKMSKSVGNIISPATILFGGKDQKKEPAYGVDVLRLWAAGVDYTKDVSVGPTSLAQVAEHVRKLRNTARFMLGNLGDHMRTASSSGITKDDLSLIDRYVLHELYTLEKRCLEAYQNFNMHIAVQSPTTFSNSILSALYFDITKDVLYTEPVHSQSRRGVTFVLEKTLEVYTTILAPILPQLAEEIHERGLAVGSEVDSVFTGGWKGVDECWNDAVVASEMTVLLQVRDRVMQLLETARRDGRIRSALEAVVLIEPTGASVSGDTEALLQSRSSELKSLFIVSDVNIVNGGPSVSPASAAAWEYQSDHHGIKIIVRPSPQHKCPRCWQYTAPKEDTLCGRCEDVVKAS
ncbi:isoleucyl-tRNA synthetase [Clavulina sp. PMI_390]|nr:isoleucyl-tRNA synthetase [Clavulina sp. PMI_390]